MLCFPLVKETVFIVFKQVFNFVDSLPNDCTGPPQLRLHRGFNIKMMFRACVCLFYFRHRRFYYESGDFTSVALSASSILDESPKG